MHAALPSTAAGGPQFTESDEFVGHAQGLRQHEHVVMAREVSPKCQTICPPPHPAAAYRVQPFLVHLHSLHSEATNCITARDGSRHVPEINILAPLLKQEYTDEDVGLVSSWLRFGCGS